MAGIGDAHEDSQELGPSDPGSMGVYFAPKDFRYTAIAKDITDGDDGITETCVLSAGEKFLYVLPDCDTIMLELRRLRLKGFPKANPEEVYDVFIRNHTSLCRSYPAGIIIKDITLLKKEEFDETILNLPPLGVTVIWEWKWEDEIIHPCPDDNMTNVSETDITHVSETACSDDGDHSAEDDLDATICTQEEAVQHTVTFKCIGSKYVPHSQEALCNVSKLLAKGDIVPVNIYPEPDNPRDSKAIAFKCWLEDKWHKIGYIVREALDDVHKARELDEIISVAFKWAKYLPVCPNSGPGYYAGINITKHGQWSSVVCACASTR